MSVTNLRQQIALQLTPSSDTDKVDASEVRTVHYLEADLFVAMGVLQATSTDDLSTKGQADALFAYVDGSGFFIYRAQGTIDNTTVFAATDGGAWEQALAVAAGDGGGGSVDLSGYVPVTRTVNGRALSADLTLSKADFPDLNLLDNTPDDSKPISTAQQEQFNILTALLTTAQQAITDLQRRVTALESAVVFKADLVGGLVPTNELPSYVSDILSYSTLSAFPVTGQLDKLYVASDDTAKLYRWTGSVYININGSGGGAAISDAYFTTTTGQTVVSIPASIGKYVFQVRIGSDMGWKVIHGGSGALLEYQVRHDATAGSLTFGSALPTSDNNLALFF